MNEICVNDIALLVSIARGTQCVTLYVLLFSFRVVVDFQWDIEILLLVDKLIEKVLSCNAQQDGLFRNTLVLQSPPSLRHGTLHVAIL